MNRPQDKAKTDSKAVLPDDPDTQDQVMQEKLLDAQIPGFQAEFDPVEAERLGAFKEDALSIDDALDSSIDVQ
jgi:hypothetical protein